MSSACFGCNNKASSSNPPTAGHPDLYFQKYLFGRYTPLACIIQQYMSLSSCSSSRTTVSLSSSALQNINSPPCRSQVYNLIYYFCICFRSLWLLYPCLSYCCCLCELSVVAAHFLSHLWLLLSLSVSFFVVFLLSVLCLCVPVVSVLCVSYFTGGWSTVTKVCMFIIINLIDSLLSLFSFFSPCCVCVSLLSLCFVSLT
jgi:hypothetical protein